MTSTTISVEAKHVPAPASGQTRSGYGRAIPNPTMVRLDGRWRRVYTTIWSNAGTSWVRWRGRKHIVRRYGDKYEVDTDPWA